MTSALQILVILIVGIIVLLLWRLADHYRRLGATKFSEWWVTAYYVNDTASPSVFAGHDRIVSVGQKALCVRPLLGLGRWVYVPIDKITRLEQFRENPLDMASYDEGRKHANVYSNTPPALQFLTREGALIQFAAGAQTKGIVLFPKRLAEFLQALGRSA